MGAREHRQHSKKLSVPSTQAEMYPVLFVSGNSVPALFSDTPEIPGGCFIAWWECSEGNIPDAMGVVVNAMIAWDCCTLVALSKLSIPVSTDSIFMFVVLCFLYIIQR